MCNNNNHYSANYIDGQMRGLWNDMYRADERIENKVNQLELKISKLEKIILELQTNKE